MPKKEIKKRFPATISSDTLTFINDKKIDAELYAILQGLSEKYLTGETVVYKKTLPTQSNLCKQLHISSPKTYRAHLNYLIEKGYVVEEEQYYVLPNKEDIYQLIPLETIRYLNNNCKEHVYKIYIFLTQMYNWKRASGEYYIFNSDQLGKAVGLKIKNYSKGYEIINDALTLLSLSGLIRYVEFFDGQTQKKKLLSVSVKVAELKNDFG